MRRKQFMGVLMAVPVAIASMGTPVLARENQKGDVVLKVITGEQITCNANTG
ncbi:hypothetical protein [Blautia sp. Marseille-P3201T]|uniref:hypothetical protein n=1 Tax=Blautia sp. Marseille-P3201T TaxID=1907659 RepID=UPI000AEAAFDE|nr:hypothetical protein [Blautia sp. Marseille-P3201T]